MLWISVPSKSHVKMTPNVRGGAWWEAIEPWESIPHAWFRTIPLIVISEFLLSQSRGIWLFKSLATPPPHSLSHHVTPPVLPSPSAMIASFPRPSPEAHAGALIVEPAELRQVKFSIFNNLSNLRYL